MRTIILIAALALAACRTTADMAEVARNYPPPPIEALNLRSDEWATAQERFIKFFRKAFFVDGEVNIGAPLPLTRRPRGQVALLSFEGDIDAATRAAFIYNVNLIGQVTGVPYRVVGPARDVRYGDIAVRVAGIDEIRRRAQGGGRTERKMRRKRGVLRTFTKPTIVYCCTRTFGWLMIGVRLGRFA